MIVAEFRHRTGKLELLDLRARTPMIPELDDHGYLLAGLHRATLDEVDHRFGQQLEVRRVQMQSLRWMVESVIRAGVRTIVP